MAKTTAPPCALGAGGRTGLRLVSVSALLLMAVPAPAQETAGPLPSSTLVLSVYPARSLPPQTLSEAMAVAGDILARANLAIAWVNCDTAPTACAARVHGSVVVRLTSGGSWKAEGCGWSVRKPGAGARGFISLDPDCAHEFAMSLRYSAEGMTLQPPLLLGALLAHEVGHVFGLRHTTKGLMRSSIGVTEWRALAAGHLGFDFAERQQLAAATAAHQPTAMNTSQ